MATDTFRILTEISLQIAGQEGLKKLDEQIKQTTTDNEKLNKTAAALRIEIEKTNSTAQKAVLQTALKNTEVEIQKNVTAAKKLSGELGTVAEKVKEVNKPQSGTSGLSTIFNFSVGNLAANAIQNLGASIASTAIGTVDAAGRFEQYRIQLNTLFKSAEVGKKVFEDLKKTATETPFSFSELTELTARLAAYGIQDFEIIPTITTLGNIAAGVGREKLPQLVLAFGQVRAAGKLTGNELRQFSEAGVPLSELLAKSLNKSQGEIRALVTAGKIGFTDVQKALEGAAGAGGQFFDLMKRQSVTTLGAFSNFGDAVEQLQAAIGANTNGIIKDLTLIATDAVNAFKGLVEGDVVSQLQAEQATLNGLVGAIGLVTNSTLDLNEQNKLRNSLIADLRAQYPSFLGNLTDEQITTANLNVLLENSNRLYTEKLRIARQDIIVQDQNKKLADAEFAVTNRLIKGQEVLAKFNQATGKNITANSIEELRNIFNNFDNITKGSGLSIQKQAQIFGELKSILNGAAIFGSTIEEDVNNANAEAQKLNAILKVQSGEQVKSAKELQSQLAKIDEEILIQKENINREKNAEDKKYQQGQLAALLVARKAITEQISPTRATRKIETPYDPQAVKDAQKQADQIKALRIKSIKDLQEELQRLQNETDQIQNKGNDKTEARIKEQNRLEAKAAKDRLAVTRKELIEKGALTKEIDNLFGQVSGAIDTKFNVKADIEITNLREEIARLQEKIANELNSQRAEAATQKVKIELDALSDNSIENLQRKLQLQTELIDAAQRSQIADLKKANEAKASEIEKSNLTAEQKSKALQDLTEINQQQLANIDADGDNRRYELQTQYYEKVAKLTIAQLGDITRLTDAATKEQIDALNKQYLQGVLDTETYQQKIKDLTEQGKVSAIAAAILEKQQVIQIKTEQLNSLLLLIDRYNLDAADKGIVTPIDTSGVETLRKEIEALQNQLTELGQSKTQAQVDVQIDTDKVQDSINALDDPTKFLVDKLFPKIGDEAKGKIENAIQEAFQFGKEIAQQIIDEKFATIDRESEAIQRRIDAELALKNVNSERVEAERQALENLATKKEQLQKRQIAANNLQRISTLALATAQAILAINSTAAASNVAAPIVIPLVVAAIGLGIAASLIPISGAAEQGDVEIGNKGNKRKKGQSDTMLYWVSPKESIINRKATERYKPVLELINRNAPKEQVAAAIGVEPNYEGAKSTSYFHKFGTTQKVQSELTIAIKPLTDGLFGLQKTVKQQRAEQQATNELLQQIGEILDFQTDIIKRTPAKKRTI